MISIPVKSFSPSISFPFNLMGTLSFIPGVYWEGDYGSREFEHNPWGLFGSLPRGDAEDFWNRRRGGQCRCPGNEWTGPVKRITYCPSNRKIGNTLALRSASGGPEIPPLLPFAKGGELLGNSMEDSTFSPFGKGG